MSLAFHTILSVYNELAQEFTLCTSGRNVRTDAVLRHCWTSNLTNWYGPWPWCQFSNWSAPCRPNCMCKGHCISEVHAAQASKCCIATIKWLLDLWKSCVPLPYAVVTADFSEILLQPTNLHNITSQKWLLSKPPMSHNDKDFVIWKLAWKELKGTKSCIWYCFCPKKKNSLW